MSRGSTDGPMQPTRNREIAGSNPARGTDSLQTSQRLTLEEFEKLLDAYMGAIYHVAWVREHGTVRMHSIAVDAAVVARNALFDAVFPDRGDEG